MNTNGRLKVANHNSCNGKPFAGRDSAKSSVQSRGVSRKTLWGLSMVVVALFRFCMTWALNVPPEPVNVALTSITGVLGVTLFTWGRLETHQIIGSAMEVLNEDWLLINFKHPKLEFRRIVR